MHLTVSGTITRNVSTSMLFLAALLSFSAPAYPAFINIVGDQLTLVSATSSPHGDDDIVGYTGPSLYRTIDQEAATSVDDEALGNFGSFYARSRFSATDSPLFSEYLMTLDHITDHPYEGDAEGYAYLETVLQLAFDVSGDGGSLFFDGSHYGQSPFVDVSFTLFDTTTNTAHTGISNHIELSDSHSYLLTYQSTITTSADLDVYHDIILRGTVVPEPSMLILFASGLLALTGRSRIKRTGVV